MSSLYVFDALSRAARHHVNKQGLTGDMNSMEGNCATFLLKVEGVLEGLFQDMIMVGSSEAKVSFVLSLLICDIGDILHCGTLDGSTQSYASKQAPHITRVHHASFQVSYIVYMARASGAASAMIASSDSVQ